MSFDASTIVFPWQRRRPPLACHLGVNVTAETKRALEQKADAEKTTVAQIVRRALDAAVTASTQTRAEA